VRASREFLPSAVTTTVARSAMAAAAREARPRSSEQRTVVGVLICAGAALVLMALFFEYQKWRYDSTTAGT
jgi:hypothetical protein